MKKDLNSSPYWYYSKSTHSAALLLYAARRCFAHTMTERAFSFGEIQEGKRWMRSAADAWDAKMREADECAAGIHSELQRPDLDERLREHLNQQLQGCDATYYVSKMRRDTVKHIADNWENLRHDEKVVFLFRAGITSDVFLDVLGLL